jgi:molybdopterin synthase sulfur carrier subunit
MMATVKIPTPMRRHVGGASTVKIEGARVREVLANLQGQYPTIGERIFEPDGKVKSYVNIFLNNEDIRFLNGLDTPLRDNDTVVLLPALAGG